MFNILLTQSSAPIIGPLQQLFGWILDGIFNGLEYVFGIQNLAISIIVFTIIARFLMLPLAIKQQKSIRQNSIIQPELRKIQNKYKGKKDQDSQRKMQQQISELYKKHNVNPLSGCFTMLIQFPIIIALFGVLRNIPAYINSIKDMYIGVVNNIKNVEGYEKTLEAVSETTNYNLKSTSDNHIVDFLANFKKADWNVLYDNFSSISEQIKGYANQIIDLNNFVGIDLADSPGYLFPGILIPLLSVITQLLVSKTMHTPSSGDNKTAAQTQKTMMYIFPLISGYFVMMMPAGLGLYWITGNIFMFIQQILINKYLKD